jgi:hypothetical protein
MSNSSAERMRLRRERAREGRFVVSVEIDESDIEVAAQLLDPLADHTRADVADAIKRLLKTISCEA